MFSFFKNKTPVVPTTIFPTATIVVPMPSVKGSKVTVEKVVVKAFAFRYNITHMVEGDPKPHQTYWTSELFFDYREATKVSQSIVRSIIEQLNTSKDEFIFITDFSVKRSTVVTVNAYDVVEVTITDGVMTSSRELALPYSENLIHIKPENFKSCTRQETFFAQ